MKSEHNIIAVRRHWAPTRRRQVCDTDSEGRCGVPVLHCLLPRSSGCSGSSKEGMVRRLECLEVRVIQAYWRQGKILMITACEFTEKARKGISDFCLTTFWLILEPCLSEQLRDNRSALRLLELLSKKQFPFCNEPSKLSTKKKKRIKETLLLENDNRFQSFYI